MYSVFAFGSMILDEIRMEAYTRALQQVITPETVVLDIGTGTGILALLACKFGARHVYAIDVNDAVQVARDIAAKNGLSERITFFQDSSLDVELPERADVIVSDLRGVLPPLQKHIPIIADARRRFLAPGGTLIPQNDTLYAAIVEAPDIYARFDAPWQTYDFDMQVARKIAVNSWQKIRVGADHLLSDSAPFATLDYTTVESPHIVGSIDLRASRSGTAHGLSLWFEAQVAEGIRYSTAPDAPEMIYGNTFFPLEKPVTVNEGDAISVDLSARLVDVEYVWSWNSRFPNGTQFRQSTLLSMPLSLEKLRKTTPTFTPRRLNEKGECVLLAITLMNQQKSLQDIASEVMRQFPRLFPDERDALAYVGTLAQKYAL
jgi:protein arginine N-methyltransferase 1